MSTGVKIAVVEALFLRFNRYYDITKVEEDKIQQRQKKRHQTSQIEAPKIEQPAPVPEKAT